jgi:hypothetical protein
MNLKKQCFIILIILSQYCFSSNNDSIECYFFSKAIRNHSTASSLILVTLVNLNNNEKRISCVYAELLVIGLFYEHNLVGQNRALIAEKMAIESKDKVFTFKNKKALELLRCYYDENTLNKMRQIFSNKTDMELKEIFKSNSESTLSFQNTYSTRGKDLPKTFAVAHILLERGFWPYIGCEDQLLHIEKPSSK